ncbi:MAG: UPF0182 family protein [Acidobacteria bacterium]|nr:UPF0182 family protein [Acidobacteriota bacterium]
MSVDDRGDARPPQAFRGGAGAGGAPTPWKAVGHAGRALGLGAGVLLAVIAADILKSIYVDYLWFRSVGFDGVFFRRVNTQVPLFLAGYLVAGVAIGGSIWLARRSVPSARSEKSFIPELPPAAIWRMADLALAGVALLGALAFGAAAAGAWGTVLQWLQAVPFGEADPQFGRDIGFFLFHLPAYRFVQSWLAGLVLACALGAGAVYGLSYALQTFQLRVTPGMRTHLSVLGGGFLLIVAVGTHLGAFELVTSSQGLVHGALYTDINARLPLRHVLATLAATAGLAVVGNAFLSSRGVRLPLAVVGVWVAATVGAGLYASVVQAFQVDPNELRREAPYIQRNIDATRRAWGLDRIVEAGHPARPLVTPEEISANQDTLENIRLLDPDAMIATLNELQALRPLYRFADIDISRYPLNRAQTGGADQQVLISARELDLDRVADRNWTRDHLQLTHGFGAIVTPVTEVEDEGLPRLALRDIPPRTAYDRLALTVDGSRIYFGELTRHDVIVNTRESEFDYPDPQVEGRDIRTSYAHDRGIVLSSRVRRLLLAWELGDLNLLISSQIHNDSRLLMRRQIAQRVQRVAPFLRLDSDPYLVIADGELKWLLPAYTSASTYPYSQSAEGINYIRSSVQVVVDAGTGDMDFYLVDLEDPVALTFSRIFPELFTPGTAMPDALRQQVRYPQDLLRLQAQHYQGYHVTDAEIFFLGEDFWQLPVQRTRAHTQAMEPYYVTMRLPGEDRVEFVLIVPFTPRGRENTIAWLAGRSDGPHFGSLRNYRFPSGVLVFGPSQVDNRIDQNALISQQLTLWDTAGSEVLRSTLMMVPVGDAFLYVQPVYLQAAGGRMPELRRVIVANGSVVAMEETFSRALDVVTGQRGPAPPEAVHAQGNASASHGTLRGENGSPPARPAAPGELQRLLRQAQESSKASQAELDRLRRVLEEIDAHLQEQGP